MPRTAVVHRRLPAIHCQNYYCVKSPSNICATVMFFSFHNGYFYNCRKLIMEEKRKGIRQPKTAAAAAKQLSRCNTMMMTYECLSVCSVVYEHQLTLAQSLSQPHAKIVFGCSQLTPSVAIESNAKRASAAPSEEIVGFRTRSSLTRIYDDENKVTRLF